MTPPSAHRKEFAASRASNLPVTPGGVVDKRAQSILFNTYWSTAGWRKESERLLSAEDFEYAKGRRVMFDRTSVTHEQVLDRLAGAIAQLNPQIVADAFVASLSTRRLDWRSALGSYAVFHALSPHSPAPGDRSCECCGLYLSSDAEDFSVMNFERLKWGGVRHLYPEYAMLDLELFLEQGAPTPTAEDVSIFRQLVDTISNVPPGVSSAALQGYLGGVLKSNKSERDCIVGILGYCGVLGTNAHPGFAGEFFPRNRRPLPDRHFVDMPYPACWWCSEEGVNKDRLNEYFGHML